MKGLLATKGLLDFTGRIALVTGAAGGIGLAATKRFAEAGAGVMLADRDTGALEGAREQVLQVADAGSKADATGNAVGQRAEIYALDLTDREQIAAFWNGLSDDDLPDIVVNNAGIYPMQGFLEMDELFWRQTLAVNLDAVLWMCQHFIRRRKALGLGGSIINVSSIEAILPFKEDMVAYSTSKAGVLTLTRALARDYGKDGFQINVIVPGAIRTPGTQRLIKRALGRMQLRLWRTGYDFQQRLPLRRWGHPDEVARVIMFLASEMATYVRGAVIPVDGGFLST